MIRERHCIYYRWTCVAGSVLFLASQRTSGNLLLAAEVSDSLPQKNSYDWSSSLSESSMRERRHQSGSSNANQRPVSAVSPRHPPPPLHHHPHQPMSLLAASPRNQVPELLLSSPSRKESALSTVSKSGAATARRPVTVVELERQQQQHSKRQIQASFLLIWALNLRTC